MAERLAEEDRRTHGREQGRGEGDRRGAGHRHEREAVEEAAETHDLERRADDVEAHPPRDERGPPAPDEPRCQDQQPEQVAEEDEDEGLTSCVTIAREHRVDRDAGRGDEDEQGTGQHG